MRQLLPLWFLLMAWCFASQLPAQATLSSELLFKNQIAFFPSASQLEIPAVRQTELVEGRYFRLLQFLEMPDATLHQQLAQAGIELLDYIPHKAYFASIPQDFSAEDWSELKLRALVPIDPSWKMAPALAEIAADYQLYPSGQLDLTLSYFKNLSAAYIIQQLEQNGCSILQASTYSTLVQVQIPIAALSTLSQLPFVRYLEPIGPAAVPENNSAAALHRNNLLYSPLSTGRHYDGTGVSVLVRDDGNVGPHIDFHGRLFQEADASDGPAHGDQVAGVLAGAGNLDPAQRGIAPGVDLYVRKYTDDFLDETLLLHLQKGITISNSSYGDGCNTGYTINATTADQQGFQYPTLLHVFSAGNSGTSDCGYGAGATWGNITGGHKQGKNVLTTGNVDGRGKLVENSSRGPAYDGRIKPDICAQGQGQSATLPNNSYGDFGGTSAAAPGLAGTLAQLSQAYQELNEGEAPPAALLKAIVLNTTQDLATPGPDFQTGWGQVNALRAIELIEEQRYLRGTIAQGEKNIHSISIPEQTAEVRFMLYWADPAAAPQVVRALSNDLNLVVKAPDASAHLPWVLDPSPDPQKLALPAQRGVDRLNNMEQVHFQAATPGTYEVEISGYEIPFASATYFITYEIIQPDLKLTFPNGGEALVPQQKVNIHWDAPTGTSPFDLSYSLDDGQNWLVLGTAESDARNWEWEVPQLVQGKLRIKISRENYSDTSDAGFSIAPAPAGVAVVQVCPNTLKLAWEALPEASEYEVYKLGEKYMEVVDTTADTFLEIPIQNPYSRFWLAVRALGPDGFRSRRSVAITYDAGILNCTFEKDLAINFIQSPNVSLVNTCEAWEEKVAIQVRNNGSMPQNNFSIFYQLDNEAVVEEEISLPLAAGASQVFTFQKPLFLDQPGQHQLQCWVALNDDLIPYNNTSKTHFRINFFGAVQTPIITEDFEQSVFPPPHWLLENPDSAQTWETYRTTGSDGQSNQVARLGNYHYSNYGAKDELWSMPIDLQNMLTPILLFDWAYAPSTTGRVDSFVVELYTNCGQNLEQVLFGAAGERLATALPTGTEWEPQSAADWKKQQIDLSEYIGEEILLRFIAFNRRGNNFYLDNIQLLNTPDLPQAGIGSSAAVACVQESISIYPTATGISIDNYEWDFGSDALPFSSANGVGPFEIFYTSPGSKNIFLEVRNPNGSHAIDWPLEVVAPPTPAFTYDQKGGTILFANKSTEALSYFWDFGDGQNSTVENPIHTYDTDGDYWVSLSVYSAYCEPVILEQEVSVSLSSSTQEQEASFAAQIVPNPNNGIFQLEVNDFIRRDISLELYDVMGKKVHQALMQSNAGFSRYAFDQNQLSAGVYFLHLESDAGLQTLKIVVQ